MTRITCLWIPDLPLVPDDGVYLFLCHLNPAVYVGFETGVLGIVARAVSG